MRLILLAVFGVLHAAAASAQTTRPAPAPAAPSVRPEVRVIVPRPVPLGAPYNENNPYARILSDQTRVIVVAENESALAFLIGYQTQLATVQVVSKSRAVSLIDSDPENLAGTMRLVRCIAIAQTRAFSGEGLTGMTLSQTNGAPHQTTGHLVFQLRPSYAGRQQEDRKQQEATFHGRSSGSGD